MLVCVYQEKRKGERRGTMKKRLVAVLVCAVMVMSAVAGCGGTPAEEGASTELGEVAEEEEVASSGEKITVTFSNLWVEGEGLYRISEESAAKFNEENEDAEIIVESMPQEAYLTQMQARGTADDFSEIVMVNGTMMKAFSDTGAIIDLTDILSESGLVDHIDQGLLPDLTNIDDERVYAIPVNSGFYGFILYNTEIFQEAGVTEFPTTIDEFNDACEKIKAAGYTPMGLGMRDQWAGDSILFSAMVNNYVGNEWYQNIRKRNGEANFTDSEFVTALTDYQNMAVNAYFNEDFVSISNDERLALFLNEEVAMVSAGDWEVNNIINSNPEFDEIVEVGYWIQPTTDAKAEDSIVKSAAWGMAFGSKITEEQIDVASRYIKDYFMAELNGKMLVEEYNMVPAWSAGDVDESKLSAITVSALDAVDNGNACQNWDASLDPTIKEIYQRGLQELLMNTVTPEDLAAQMQEELDMLK